MTTKQEPTNGLPEIDKITWARIQVWDNGAKPPKGKDRFGVKVWYTADPVTPALSTHSDDLQLAAFYAKDLNKFLALSKLNGFDIPYYKAVTELGAAVFGGQLEYEPVFGHIQTGSTRHEYQVGGFAKKLGKSPHVFLCVDGEWRDIALFELGKQKENDPRWQGYYDPYGFSAMRAEVIR